MGRNTGRGKVAYSWISPDPAKAGPTLGVVVVVGKYNLHSSEAKLVLVSGKCYVV